MSESNYKYDVFLSFSELDFDEANSIWEKLCRKGILVFWSYNILKERIGDSWFEAIQDSLIHSKDLILIWTNNAQNSDWVKLELKTFYTQCCIKDNNRKLLILVKDKKDIDTLPPFYKDIQIAFTEDEIIKQLEINIQNQDSIKREAKISGDGNYFKKKKPLPAFIFISITIMFLTWFVFFKDQNIVKSSSQQINKTKFAHDTSVSNIVFSLNEKQLISTSEAGPAKLWNLSRNKLYRTLDRHQGPGIPYVSPKGSYLVLSSFPDDRGTFVSEIYDLPSGKHLFTISRCKALVKDQPCIITPDESLLILSSGKRTYENLNTITVEPNILLISLPKGVVSKTLYAPASYLAVSHDNKTLLSFGHVFGNNRGVHGVKNLAPSCPYYRFITWSIPDGKCLFKSDSTINYLASIKSISVDKEFKHMFFSREQGKSKLSQLNLPKLNNEKVIVHKDTLDRWDLPFHYNFSINGSDSLLVCDQYRLFIYDNKSTKLVSRLDNNRQEILKLIYSINKRLAAGILWDREYDSKNKRWKYNGYGVGFWDLSKNIRINNLQYQILGSNKAKPSFYSDIQFSKKGNYFAIADRAGAITLWNLNTFSLIDSLNDKKTKKKDKNQL